MRPGGGGESVIVNRLLLKLDEVRCGPLKHSGDR